MADAVSSPVESIVERLVSEGLINVKVAAKLYSATTHKCTVTRHATKGVRMTNGHVLKLEIILVGGRLMTSRAAVLRFFAARMADSTLTQSARLKPSHAHHTHATELPRRPQQNSTHLAFDELAKAREVTDQKRHDHGWHRGRI